MSAIYFHTQDGEARLRGSERAYMGCWVKDIFITALTPLDHTRKWLEPALPAAYRARSLESLELFLAGYSGAYDSLILDGVPVSIFSLQLNTAFNLGGDALKLMAHLHGQCEIHCYIEGHNRAWLAELVTEARAKNILRADQGWPKVIELLRRDQDQPVVCSYSVTDSFPGPHLLPPDHPLNEAYYEDDEAYYELPTDEQWRLGLEAVRNDNRFGTEICPERWQNFYFDSGLSAFDLPPLLRKDPTP